MEVRGGGYAHRPFKDTIPTRRAKARLCQTIFDRRIRGVISNRISSSPLSKLGSRGFDCAVDESARSAHQ